MGYTTDFWGEFHIIPPLSPAHKEYLKAFAATRRMSRKNVAHLPDPIREAVGLPVGPEGAFYVGGESSGDGTIADYNTPPPGQPGLWCQWIPSETHEAQLVWDEGEKFYHYVEWLEYLIDKFLTPWGYSLAGMVEWQGEEHDDRGRIKIESPLNKVIVQVGEWVWS